MNTKLFLLFIISLFSVSLTANAAAYTSSTKSAEVLGDNFRLYSIGFDWSFKDRDLLIPVLAQRGLEADTNQSSLGYEIKNENGLRVKTGTTTALVIANLPIENGYYRLKAGEVGQFRLLALHEAASSTQPLKLQVSALPFKFNTKGKETKTYLNRTELKGYVTNAK
jgi:hypothetical protein